MNKLLVMFVMSVMLTAAGCGKDGISTTGGSGGIELSRTANTVTTSTGGVIYVEYDETGLAGSEIQLMVKLREPGATPGSGTGTVHWHDNTESRVRDGDILRHIYTKAGTYTVAVHPDTLARQPDGSERIIVGNIVIGTAPPTLAASCPTLSIPGVGPFSCSAPLTPGNKYYQVDDTVAGGCPQLTTVSSSASTGNTIIVEDVSDPNNDVGRIVSIVAFISYHTIFSCVFLPFELDVPFVAGSIPFSALSGATWNANYTVTGDVNGVTASDMVLTPM